MVTPSGSFDARSAAQAFTDAEIAPHVASWEAARSMAPPDVYRKAGDAGLLSMAVPEAHGGAGVGFDEKVAAFDVITEASMASAFSMINTHNVAVVVAEQTSEATRDRLLPRLMAGEILGSTALTEPSAGSDFAAITTPGTTVEGGWVLNGEKAWITNAARSEVIVCYVQTAPDAGAKGIASFLIDASRPGFVRSEPEALTSSHGIGTGGFVLDNYEITDADMIAAPGEAFLAALSSINGARTYVASMCVAMVRASLQTAVAYGKKRTAFGKPLLDYQGLNWSLADVANQLAAAELLVQRAIEAVVATEQGGVASDAILPAAHAKKFACEMAEPAIAACLQSMGAAGLRDEYPLSRHLGAARIANFTDGSTEMMNERIARSL